MRAIAGAPAPSEIAILEPNYCRLCDSRYELIAWQEACDADQFSRKTRDTQESERSMHDLPMLASLGRLSQRVAHQNVSLHVVAKDEIMIPKRDETLPFVEGERLGIVLPYT